MTNLPLQLRRLRRQYRRLPMIARLAFEGTARRLLGDAMVDRVLPHLDLSWIDLSWFNPMG